MTRRHPIILCTTVGVVVGLLLSTMEVVRAFFLIPGESFRPSLLVYGAILYGGALGGLGLVVGLIWQLVRTVRRGSNPAPAGVPGPAIASDNRGVSRRSLLKLLAVTAALSGISFAWLLPRRTSRQAPTPLAPSLAPSAAPQPYGAAGPAAPATGVTRPPNIVLVTVDTLRADQLGAYGHPYVATPALDVLASQGAMFRSHIVEQPQTNPSHASIFTGTYPSTNGLRVHMLDKLPDSIETLATVCQRAGYATAGVYSWMSLDPEYSNLQLGFQTYTNVAPGTPDALKNPLLKQVAARYREAEQFLSLPQLANQVVGVKSQTETDAKGRADITTDAAIVELERLAGQPFLLWVHYFDPHYPYQAPDPFANMYDPGYKGPLDSSMQTVDAISNGTLDPKGDDLTRLLTYYQGEIVFTDQQIGRLMQSLDQQGLTENTILALTGDHGEAFGEHYFLTIHGEFFHPHSLFNTELQVPLLLRYPPRIRAGTVVNGITQSVDLLPSLLGFSGLPVPAQVQGTSVIDLEDGAPSSDRRAFSAMWDNSFYSLTSGGWKLIRNNANGQLALFDQANDPGELHDAATDQPDLVREMEVKLLAWAREEHLP